MWSAIPLEKVPEELVFEIFSHLPQSDRLTLCLLNKKYNKIATKLLYRRIYLNDSNVVKSDYINLAVNWTLLNIPSFLSEEQSRTIANEKLEMLIKTLEKSVYCVESVEWIRINWDLDSGLQRRILNILCNKGKSIKRLENITDPGCNYIIASGKISKNNVTSFDLAPPNSLPELTVPQDYIPNAITYLNQRISTNLSHMTLFIDPLKLFTYLHPLKQKLQIVDLKLHWRREFYQNTYFWKKVNTFKPELKKLSDIFDTRSLKILTIISWNEILSEREVQMIRDFKDFVKIEDLSLISIKQDINILIPLFSKLTNLKRLKMDFLEDYIPESTNPEIFLTMMISCKNLQFIDMRFQGIDKSIISITTTENPSEMELGTNVLQQNKFVLSQFCHCDNCNHVFKNILKSKIFLYPEDDFFQDVHDIAAKDIFKMMRYLSLLPYSKACDYYPSVRTQPMNLKEFVKKMNKNLTYYRRSRNQLTEKRVEKQRNNNSNSSDNEDDSYFVLPHEPLTETDIIDCYHSMIHQYKTTYIAFLKRFPKLRFLMLNDIPTIVVEKDKERIFEPIFYHRDYKTNLTGWSIKTKKSNEESNGNESLDTLTKKISTF